jgi:hypothetical protein
VLPTNGEKTSASTSNPMAPPWKGTLANGHSASWKCGPSLAVCPPRVSMWLARGWPQLPPGRSPAVRLARHCFLPAVEANSTFTASMRLPFFFA